MRNQEIPRSEWPAFFQSFDRAHHGHLCSLAVFGEDRESRIRLDPLMLAGVTPSNDAEHERLLVMLSDWDGYQLAHVIVGPRHVFVSSVSDEMNERVEIDAAAGRTVMTFAAAS